VAAMKKKEYKWHKRFRDGRASVNDDPRCGWPQVSEVQGLIHYYTLSLLLQKGVLQTNKCTLKSSVVSGMKWEENAPQKNGHETSGFFCTTTHLQIGRWWSKSTLRSIKWRLRSIFPETKKCSERTTNRERLRSHCKHWQKYRTRASMNASISFTNVGKTV
jgi:hypothetical protein